jgi:3-oxoacyl-[acyl-carrier-protein] synthase I
VRKEHERARTLGGEYAGDGRALGEAAGMLLLEGSPHHRGGLVVDGLARYLDEGHRFGTAPARGEGLAGESHDVKLWGIACLRHRDVLTASTRVEHPADRLGDAGAGLGAMLFVDAHHRMLATRRDGPALVWAASDHGPCGCASLYLDAPGGQR